MRFKIDENLPAEVAQILRSLGHVADTVDEEGLAGSPDPELIAAATADNRILMTLDKGIANTRRYPPASHRCVVLFRPQTVGRGATLRFIEKHLAHLLTLEIENRITVVTEYGIRQR